MCQGGGAGLTIAAIIVDAADVPAPHSHSHGGPSAHGHTHSHPHAAPERPSEHELDKLRSTLKQLVRDWAAAGAGERAACYGPIEAALLAHFGDIPFAERFVLRTRCG
jgi:carnosine N-methyltransferase